MARLQYCVVAVVGFLVVFILQQPTALTYAATTVLTTEEATPTLTITPATTESPTPIATTSATATQTFPSYPAPDGFDDLIRHMRNLSSILNDHEQQRTANLKVIADIRQQITDVHSQMASFRPPHTEEGLLTCGDSNLWPTSTPNHNAKVISVKFATVYDTPPVVLFTMDTLDWNTDNNVRIDVSVEDVTTVGFKLVCGTWHDTRIHNMRYRWISVDA